MSRYKVFKNFIVVVVLFLCLILVFPGYGYTEGNCAFNPPPQVEFYSPSGQEVRFDNDTYSDGVPLYHLTIPGNALTFEDAIKITYRLEGSLLENAGKILDILNCLQKSGPFNLEVYINGTLVLNTQVDFSPDSVQVSIKEVGSDEKLTKIEVLRYIVGEHGLFGEGFPISPAVRRALDRIVIMVRTPYEDVAQEIHTLNNPPIVNKTISKSYSQKGCSYNIRINYSDLEGDKVTVNINYTGEVENFKSGNERILFGRTIQLIQAIVPYNKEAEIIYTLTDEKGGITQIKIPLYCSPPSTSSSDEIIQDDGGTSSSYSDSSSNTGESSNSGASDGDSAGENPSGGGLPRPPPALP